MVIVKITHYDGKIDTYKGHKFFLNRVDENIIEMEIEVLTGMYDVIELSTSDSFEVWNE